MPRGERKQTTKVVEKKERREQITLARVKSEGVMAKIDVMAEEYKTAVDNQLQLMLARMQPKLLQMKWNEFLRLQSTPKTTKLKKDVKRKPLQAINSNTMNINNSNTKNPNNNNTMKNTMNNNTSNSNNNKQRSQSTVRNSRCKFRPAWPQAPQVQSVDRLASIRRMPKPGELALSVCGSPLALRTPQSHDVANIQIPTKSGVILLEPHKLVKVNDDLLQQLDTKALQQIKTLQSNLEMIVQMAEKS